MTDHTTILIPGLICDRIVWDPIIGQLGPDIIIADLTTHNDITAMARDCLALTEGRIRVAGHSMGARVALEMARLAPDRVERLALLDTGIHPLKDGEREKRDEIVAFAHANGMQALSDRWLPGMVHPSRHDDNDLMIALNAMVLRQSPVIHEQQITALVNRPDAAAYLSEISCPVLLMVGRQDAWSPVSQHEDMLALLPDAQLVVIEDAGHFAPVEQPAATAAALVPFLTERTA